jgi:hypothetical protein
VPDPETDVELPVEDAVEQEQWVAPPVQPDGIASTLADRATDGEVLEADEVDLADQQSVVGYDEEDYR